MREKLFSFSLPIEHKKQLEQLSKKSGLSMAGYLKLLIVKCFTELENAGKHDTGRGHIDIAAIEKTKEFMRKKHPQPVRIVDIAEFTGKSQARAARLLDYLSGNCTENENTNTDFLVYCNDEQQPKTYGIFKDTKKGIFAC